MYDTYALKIFPLSKIWKNISKMWKKNENNPFLVKINYLGVIYVEKRKRSFSCENKLFRCNLCGKRFTKNSNLKRHMLSVHEGDKSFKWDFYEKVSHHFGR